jgi:hypothetical protein
MGNSEAKAAAEGRFRARLNELGVTLLEPYQGSHHPHQARCAAGHECSPRPGDVLKGGNPCGSCAGRNSDWSEAKFRSRLADLGGELLEPSWLGTHIRHRVKCAAGHETTPLPCNMIAGHGICVTCAGNDPKVGEARFRTRLDEVGATLLEPYHGSGVPHRVRCAAGHECRPRPGDVLRGGGVCRTCAGQDPAVAEARFRTRLAKLGATLLEPYHGSGVPHQVRCVAGHECWPRPNNLSFGRGICKICACNDPTDAEIRFCARVARLGGKVIGAYRGGHIPVEVRCAAGHPCAPQPSSVLAGQGLCRTCAGQDPAVAEARFRARLDELDATLLEPYRNRHTPVRVRCAAGHECSPRSGSVLNGGGICRTCAGLDPQMAKAAFLARLDELGATLLEPYQRALYSHQVRCTAGHVCRVRPNSLQQGGGYAGNALAEFGMCSTW